jgi:hypothetical protein
VTDGAMDLRKIAQMGEAEVPAPAFTPREQVFNVTYQSPDGEVKVAVTSRVMNADERSKAARVRATLAGVSWHMLSPDDQARIYALAHVSIQLRNVPQALSRWVAEDDALLFQLQRACSEHADRFFRGDGGPGTGDSPSPVVVEPADPAT